MTNPRDQGRLIAINAAAQKSLSPEDHADVVEAREILEHHGIADRLTRAIGMPITASMRLLPGSVQGVIQSAVEKSLTKALDVAIHTLAPASQSSQGPALRKNKWMAGLAGAAGGAFGPAVLAAELPVSTILILRSVADIARSQGEDLEKLETRLACLEVFALDNVAAANRDSARRSKGSPAVAADATEIGYFAVRAAMAKQVAAATKYLAGANVIDHAAPPLARLVAEISKRFGTVVGQKVAAQAVPVIGAIGGALINSYFIDHYQDIARAHFTIRRLERKYGTVAVQKAYGGLRE